MVCRDPWPCLSLSWLQLTEAHPGGCISHLSIQECEDPLLLPFACSGSTLSAALKLAVKQKNRSTQEAGLSAWSLLPWSLASREAQPVFEPPSWLLPVQFPRTWVSSQSHASHGPGWFLLAFQSTPNSEHGRCQELMKLDSHLAPSDQTLLYHFACLATDSDCATSLGLVPCCAGEAASGPWILIQVTLTPPSSWCNWL